MVQARSYDEALRESLIELAARTIGHSGVSGLALRRLAHDAGTSTNAVYTMFGSKAALVQTVLDRGRSSLEQAQRAVTGYDDPLDDFMALGRAYRQWALEHPAMYGLIFSADAAAPAGAPSGGDDEVPLALAPLAQVLGRLVSAGVFRADPVPLMAMSAWAMVHGAVTLELGLLQARPRHVADAVYEAHLQAGIRAWLA